MEKLQSLTIGLIQMRCEKGALEENLAAIHASLRAGAARGADIMCFPEMSITGYINPQRLPEAVLRLDGPEIARFVRMTSDIPVTAIAGFVEENPRGKPFITQVAARAGYQWWRDECSHKLGQYARDNALYIAVATQAGRTRDEDFPGGGYIFGPDGKCLIETADWSEGVIYAEIHVA